MHFKVHVVETRSHKNKLVYLTNPVRFVKINLLIFRKCILINFN